MPKLLVDIDNEKLKQLLVEDKYVSTDKLEKAEELAKSANMSIDEYLLEKKILKQSDIAKVISKLLGIKYAFAKTKKPAKNFTSLIPVNIAQKYYVITVNQTKTEVVVATDNPDQEGLEKALVNVFPDKKIILAYALPAELEAYLSKYLPQKTKKTTGLFAKIRNKLNKNKLDKPKQEKTENQKPEKQQPENQKQELDEIPEREKIITDELLKKILLDSKYVKSEDITQAIEEIKETGRSLAQTLIEKDLISEDLIGQATAEHFGVNYADLNTNTPPQEQILKLPKELAYIHYAVLFRLAPKEVIISTDNPENKELKNEIQKIFPNKKITFAYSLPRDIEKVLINYREGLGERIAKATENNERPAIKLLEEILDEAVTLKASDIHLEPEDDDVAIRFRIDGVMHEFSRIEPQYYSNIINRIKVKSHLRIDEHLKAQDGSMAFGEDEKEVNIRVSIVPTLNGEKVVMRVLSKYVEGFDLEDVGLSSTNKEILERASKKPFGMIIVTGPTGSGKTTTLYSVLKLLNKRTVNITTIEDPVEYRIKGINQIQVNNQTGLTFAKGLRSIVRQDPDIILVGEIRDQETAEIGVNAALTGHLLLSTFHSNDAATAVPRLLDMGVESFLLSSTLELLIAQRLVRKICNKCKHSYTLSKTEIKKDKTLSKHFKKTEDATLYKGEGCEACNHTGYKGRTAIFEMIEVKKALKELILKNPSSQEVWELASKNGSLSLYEDGLEKVKAGVTTLEELNRIVSHMND